MREHIINGIYLFVLFFVLLTEVLLVRELRAVRKEIRMMREGMTHLVTAAWLSQLLGLAVNRIDKWLSDR